MTTGIDSVEVNGRRVRCTVDASPSVRRFLSDDVFTATYGVDVEDVPQGILVLPVLSHVLPVAWARGDDVRVDVVDEQFARAVPEIRDTLCEMYPRFMEGGELHADRTASLPRRDESREDEGQSADRSHTDDRGDPTDHGDSSGSDDRALLFTGGVDSTCSYVRHRGANPTLIGVRGWTIDDQTDEQWRQFKSFVDGFADERGLETQFVQSNMLSFLDHPMLLAHYKRYLIGGWYSAVGSGLGLLGLCAPLAYAEGYDDLLLASSHWDGIDLPWGSHPSIDESVAWAGTTCHHDGYELTRQEKLERIAEYVRSDDGDLELRTCNDRMDGNCGYCPKCCRTAVGLAVAGLDPTEYGFPFDDRTYEYVRRCFERGEWVADEDTRIMWEDIQNALPAAEPPSPAAESFFEWVAATDFEAVVESSSRPARDRVVRAIARHTPDSVYSSLYPAYAFAKRRV